MLIYIHNIHCNLIRLLRSMPTPTGACPHTKHKIPYQTSNYCAKIHFYGHKVLNILFTEELNQQQKFVLLTPPPAFSSRGGAMPPPF